MEPRRSWSNVDEIVTIALARANNFLKHHRVRVELEKDLPAIRVDEKAMAEVIYVLVENATKYSPANTVITVSASKSGKETVQISVEDQGTGIPVDFRERVFEKFFRLSEPSLPARGAGLGMGLAIARGIVEAHKGRIWVESPKSGQGTRISLTIPLQDYQLMKQ